MLYCKKIGFFSLFLICLNSSAQNTLDLVGLSGDAPASYAYSIRKLSSTYTGNSIQVRRSSDDRTQDIGFNLDGELNQADLLNFVGANNGFITTWYDQSGNGLNLTNTNYNEQPKIVNAGTVNVENGKPFIQFYGSPSGTKNSLNLPSESATNGTVIMVNKFGAGGDGFLLGHTGSYYWHSNPPSLFASYASSSILSSKVWQNGVFVNTTSAVWNTSLMVNVVNPQTPNSGTNWDNIGSDRVYHHTNNGGGYAELIVFTAALSASNIHKVETNQGIYFGIEITMYLNKNGKIIPENTQNINKHGAIGSSIGLNTNGQMLRTRSAGNGITESTAGTSAYQIKQDYPSSTDGLYWIANPNINGGAAFKIYADMTTDGGGWTLIMQNNYVDWNFSNALLRNQTTPPSTLATGLGDGSSCYSIIGWADYIKRSASGFDYMLDASARNRNGGIWRANEAYSFVEQTNVSSTNFGTDAIAGSDGFHQNITELIKFPIGIGNPSDNGVWNYSQNGLEHRMPWYANDPINPGTFNVPNAIFTTTHDDGGYAWWGTLIAGDNIWSPSPWQSETGQGSPSVIWYWVR